MLLQAMNRAGLVILTACLSACSTPKKIEPWSVSVNPESYEVLGETYHVQTSNKGYRQQGIASWYGTKFHQKNTATGVLHDNKINVLNVKNYR